MNELSQQFSPGHLRVSLAAAMTLGLRPGIFYRGAQLHCLNLLLTYPEGCYARCSYCGLACSRGIGPEKASGLQPSFIRVEWPTFPLHEILERTKNVCDVWKRICVSMVMHPRAVEDTLWLLARITEQVELPVSVLANPSTMREGQMKDLSNAGADMASVAIDAATPEIFDACRGHGVGGPHNWDNYWRSLEEAVEVFGPGKAGCHLITGMGETEQQMINTMQRVRDLGARIHLFSFYPEPGSLLDSAAPCPASQFRRIQLARFLIDYEIVKGSEMAFDHQGRVISFGVERSTVETVVASGEPFMTSGCPGASMSCACNRPYGDGPPGDIRSFPFTLDAGDVMTVRKELATYVDSNVITV